METLKKAQYHIMYVYVKNGEGAQVKRVSGHLALSARLGFLTRLSVKYLHRLGVPSVVSLAATLIIQGAPKKIPSGNL